MELKEIFFKYIYIVCYVYATIYAFTLLLFLSEIAYIHIKKYIMFRRYKYMSLNQLQNINYGVLSKVTNNRVKEMRNYVYIRDTWPYINRTIYGYPDNKNFEKWVEWVYNNYYDDNIIVMQYLEDIIKGDTNEELIQKTNTCIRKINKLVSETRIKNFKI